jgi:hypothetical protein
MCQNRGDLQVIGANGCGRLIVESMELIPFSLAILNIKWINEINNDLKMRYIFLIYHKLPFSLML